MCVTVAAMNEKMAEIQSLKRLKEETENAIKALEFEVIYLCRCFRKRDTGDHRK